MHRRRRPASEEHQPDPGEHLHDNQSLADDKRAGEASGKRAAPEVAQEAPQPGNRHKEEHRDREPVMKYEQRCQGDLLSLSGSYNQYG